MQNSYSPEVEVEEEILTETIENKKLILYNDDVNTFDHVIDSLIKVCKHETIQAEQCTWIVHYAGKCEVKVGSFTDLKPQREALCERGLDAKIH